MPRTDREAAASATTEAREAAQLQVDLFAELRASGIKLSVAVRMLAATLGESTDAKQRHRLAARFRKRKQRRRSSGALGRLQPGGQ